MTKESEWLERVLAWRKSGLSAADFCEGKAFDVGSLRAWSSRLGRAGKVPRSRMGRPPKAAATTSTTRGRFARVLVGAGEVREGATAPAMSDVRASNTMVVSVGEVRIEVTPGVDPLMLRTVVDALAGRSR